MLNFNTDSHATASFDGSEWERPEVIQVVAEMYEAKKLPHLEEMFVKFLQGALVTWIRFSLEYAPGGLIDGLTDNERKKAFRFGTNCHNEGALGSFVVLSGNAPLTTLHCSFVDEFFTPEDHTYVMKTARTLDMSKLEREQKLEQARFNENVALMRKEKEAEKSRKVAATTARLGNVVLILHVNDIQKKGMTRAKLDDQLDKLCKMWGARISISCKSSILRHPEKVEALTKAIRDHNELLNARELPLSGLDAPEVQDVDFWEEEEDEMAEPD
ncbi:hypothetical protein CYLTODRAFT_415625 [Cylindrobasidium torrendii FP15055 ss-10]|uniref:Uncharacterized protein n=1 Tax=Cylindrobasidium torrendii FP15055 ss-10 TaxID=1314674 RepID=A0A0D7ASG1_9AGAR|nr:hypothetical protein CYLTODRAFT_415625 [Cylindrobasidium torrendii FP15055 ss-10]